MEIKKAYCFKLKTNLQDKRSVVLKNKPFIISGVDLFCGIGGLTYGLIKSGIKIRAGIDLDKSCKFAYETNNNAKFIGADISKIKGQHLEKYWKKREIRILVGCAPCQPFSTHSNKIKNKENGYKWNLLNEFSRLINETNPCIISMENVTNLANKSIFQDFVHNIEKQGYFVSYKNVFCPDYGIPQKRRRLVLLASKFNKITLIPPTHKKNKYITVKGAIGNLSPIRNGQKNDKDPLHFTASLSKKNLERIRSSVQGGTWEDWNKNLWLECHKKESGKTYKSVYGRMSWDEPSPTITTQFYNYGTGRFGHPEQDRALTVREACILQTFPTNYKLIDKDNPIVIKKLGAHVGNAVPVELGYIIGKSIIKHIERSCNA